MPDATAESNWTPPGLPAPGPGEPPVETLISVARGIARGAPWSVIAESRDLDFEEVRLWPWKFPSLWKAYLQKAVRLQVQLQVGQSLVMLEALQNSGTADESRRACETVLHYNTILELIAQKTATADKRRYTPIAASDFDPESVLREERRSSALICGSGRDDERAFLPRLPVVMPRGPNRTPRRPSGRRYALPTPEALAVLRRQLGDPDPRIAHRAARTTLLHDARLQYLEAKFGDIPLPESPEPETDGGPESADWTEDIAPDITPEELKRILEQIEANAQHDPMLRKALDIMKHPPPPDSAKELPPQ